MRGHDVNDKRGIEKKKQGKFQELKEENPSLQISKFDVNNERNRGKGIIR